MLHEFGGAVVRRVLDRGGACVPEHAHDRPVLSLFVLGGYANRTDLGEIFISSPSALLYRAGAAHMNSVSPAGFEQIEIEFDPDWLGGYALPDAPVSRWLGGRAGAEARRLARTCRGTISEVALRAAVGNLIESASHETRIIRPAWFDTVTRRLREETNLKVGDLARQAGLHPSWLGAAYRRCAGEGLSEAAARFRTERAAALLRETALSFAYVAAEAGFCDQSHMNRTFRRLLGRTPGAVRDDAKDFRPDCNRRDARV